MLDAAIQVLGTGGARALTHRAADDMAGLPQGTTSNYFRTRKALIAGVLAHICAIQAEPADLLNAADLTVEDWVQMTAEHIEFSLGPGRILTLARHALMLEASLNPALRPTMIAESQRWWNMGAELLRRLGSPDPVRRGRWLFVYVDGLLVDQLSRPDAEFDAEAAVRAVLDGIMAPSLDGAP